MPSPIISVSQMREWETASWAAGCIEVEVIGCVGKIVAARVRQLASPGELVLILAGKGHNGDDARRAQEHLSDFRVAICNVTDPGLARPEMEGWLDQQPALVVDGLFGIGINRPLNGPWRALIDAVNQRKLRVLAVDVPSGLNSETGVAEGAAIEASVTLTLGAPKRGLLATPAWPYVGRLEVAPQIGLVPCPFASDMNWTLPGDFKNFPPPRANAAHKGTFGHLGIFAGSQGYHGAAVLASRGAQRAQPGLITLHAQKDIYPVVASQLQAVMVSPWQKGKSLPEDYDALLIGAGLAAKNLPGEIKKWTQRVWHKSTAPVIVDASALDWLSGSPTHKDAIRVITPHPGEAARLLDATTQEVQADRPKALREISRRLGNCWVVLKGAQTLIGRSTGGLVVNSSGNPHLAQGGSGDVLGGFLAGLLAQSALQADPLKTLAYGVGQHGAAADRLSMTRANWTVEDLAAEIGRVNC